MAMTTTRYDLIIWLLPFEDYTQVYVNGRLLMNAPTRSVQPGSNSLEEMYLLGMCDRTEDPGVMYGFGRH